MRLSFFVVALLPCMMQETEATLLRAEGLAWLDALQEGPEVMATAETGSAVGVVTDADLKASTDVMVDLDCLG